ncbi:unnamed protein product [Pocillopora meandrina]|uniref:Uncharacterized protein n=1 Tax=Pocillopora meandrina TaxID=46732 RepID=A0AAU9WM80_9CNID|nr:unnamed protein product [Pocillopora meandrina]
MSTSTGVLGSGSKTKEQVVKRDFSHVPSVEVSAPTRMGNCEMCSHKEHGSHTNTRVFASN